MSAVLNSQQVLFDTTPAARSTREYANILTAEINDKGVLDVDAVKGCTLGIRKRELGCYDACYAATIARFRGIDFGHSVTRKVVSYSHARAIERTVKAAPQGFFRVGTMGDPCHDWAATVDVIEWLAPFATPVVVTKHWRTASDDSFRRLVACGTVLNTSISALDTEAERGHRMRQLHRYSAMGGASFARIVSCEFNRDVAEGAWMAAVQDELFALPNIIDNPLRVSRSHHLVKSGSILVDSVRDLNSIRTVSLVNKNTYLGHCSQCPDVCGVKALAIRPELPQRELPMDGV